MKNIIEILAGLNITIPQDQLESFNKDFNANYKTIADYDKQATKLEQVQETLKTAQEGLKAFEGVDVNDLKGQITKLTGDLEAEQAKHAQELSDMSFNSSIEDAIRAVKGKNPMVLWPRLTSHSSLLLRIFLNASVRPPRVRAKSFPSSTCRIYEC